MSDALQEHRFTSVTLDQIRKAAAYANFGASDPAMIVCRGLLQISGGFSAGYTVQCILQDLKLVGRMGRRPTKLGRLFLYDLYKNHDPLIELQRTTPSAPEGDGK